MCFFWSLFQILRSFCNRSPPTNLNPSIRCGNEAPARVCSGGGSAVGRICAQARGPRIRHQLGRRLGGLPTAGVCACKRPQRLSQRHIGEAEDAFARGSQWSLGDEGRHGSQGAAERTWPAYVRETTSFAQALGDCKTSFATLTAINATTTAFGAPAPAASNNTPRAFLAQFLHSGS